MLYIKASTFSIAATDSEKNQIMLEEKTLQVDLKRIEKGGRTKDVEALMTVFAKMAKPAPWSGHCVSVSLTRKGMGTHKKPRTTEVTVVYI